MDFRDSSRRPAARPAAPAQTVTQQPQTPGAAPVTHVTVHNNSPLKKWLVPAVLLLALVIAGFIGWKMVGATGDVPRDDRYQAVFLDNGQVFFGHLKNTSGDYLTLEKAFYTQKSDLPEDATAEQKQATSNNVSLVKVGDEVYGPESTMKIRSEQILFWQDLTNDSKVAKAMDSAK